MYSAECTWIAGDVNVDFQTYTWLVNGEESASGQMQANEQIRNSAQDGVTINPTDTVTFVVVSANQWGTSDPATAVGTAPAPVPEAPTNVQMTFTEIASGQRR